MKSINLTSKQKKYLIAGAVFLFFYRKVRRIMENREKAIDLIARTAYGEDSAGGSRGMQAVINVIQNRRRRGGWFGGTWEDVILKPYQFSIWNAKTVPAAYGDDPVFQIYLNVIQNVTEKNVSFAEAKRLAALAYDDRLEDLTVGSTHYKLPTAAAAWAVGKTPVARVGSHEFYNNIE